MSRPHWGETLPWQRPPSRPGADRSGADAMLTAVLERCRGEGPPNCQRGCPLGVDVRSAVESVRAGRLAEALSVIRQSHPFPGILGYLCPHPCESRCVRADDDAPVRIRALERALAVWEDGVPVYVGDVAPYTGRRIAVVGGGPAGLLAAYDLRRHGHGVTVYDAGRELGGALTAGVPPWQLPRRVLERDLSVIRELGIVVRTDVAVPRDASVQDLTRSHDAVVLCPGFAGAVRILAQGTSGLGRSRRGTIAVDRLTCETGVDGVFAAGDAVTGPSSVVSAMAHGRRAAESVHRWLVGRDLREGRPGLLPERMLWPLTVDDDELRARVRPAGVLSPAGDTLTPAAAVAEAERCRGCRCRRCTEECELLAGADLVPRAMARRIAGDLRSFLPTLYSCTLCGLCGEVCPEHLDTRQMVLEARRTAVARGWAPLPEHRTVVATHRLGGTKPFTLVAPEPGRGRSSRLFFPGCALSAASPAATVALYDLLRSGYHGVGLALHCCGEPLEVLGMEEEVERAVASLRRRIDDVGAEELVTACPECVTTLRSRLPGIRTTTVWELLDASWDPPSCGSPVQVSVHDGCRARYEPGSSRAVRSLLRRAGFVVEELEFSGPTTRCCGRGGGVAAVDPALARAFARRRVMESPLPLITACARCSRQLADAGADTMLLVDALTGAGRAPARAGRGAGLSGWINRLRTKTALARLGPLARN